MRISQQDLRCLEAAVDALDRVDGIDTQLRNEILMAQAVLGRIIRSNTTASVAHGAAPRVDGMTGYQRPQSEFSGMSISEAAVSFLQTSMRSRRTTEILKALQDGEFEMTAARPEASLTAALERRAKNYRDVVKVAKGLWCVAEFLTDKERASLEHKARTARGMKQARARGVRLGTATKLSEEMAVRAKDLFEQGLPIRAIGDAIGVSHNTVRNWREKIKKWSPGQSWPPTDLADQEDETPAPQVGSGHLRAVK